MLILKVLYSSAHPLNWWDQTKIEQIIKKVDDKTDKETIKNKYSYTVAI